MSKTMIWTLLRNLALLGLGALPLFLVLVWLLAFVGGTEESRNLQYVLEAGGFYYLAYVLPVLAGGLAHQGLLLLLPSLFDVSLQRILAVLLTVIVPLMLVILGEHLATIADFSIPAILSLVVYGLLVRIPELKP